MKRKNHASVVRLTSLALLAALVVVLQTVAAASASGRSRSADAGSHCRRRDLLGPGAGAGLGAVFGVVCLIAGITGAMNLQRPVGRKPILARRRVRRQGRSVRALRGDSWQRRCGRGRRSAAYCRADGPVREHRRVCYWMLTSSSPFCRTMRAARTLSISFSSRLSA